VNGGSLRTVLDHQPDGRFLALALGLYLTALVITFTRWRLLVRIQGLPLRLFDALRVGFVGHALDTIVPGQVGSDVLKAAFLCQGQERKTLAIAATLVNRMAGILGLIVLASLMGLVNWHASGTQIRRLIAVVWVTLGLGLAGFSVVFTPRLVDALERLGARCGRRARAVMGELHVMSVAYRKRKGFLLVSLGMSTGAHTLNALAFVLVGFALLPNPPRMIEQLQIVPIIMFSTAVPLPFGALGLGEQVSDDLFRLLGHSLGVVAMLGFRLVGLAAGFISLLIYLTTTRTVARSRIKVPAAELPASV
jgi:uncharacterized protein (TIRG00374 family)